MNRQRVPDWGDSADVAFGHQLRARLEVEAQALDAVVAARLSAARHRALAAAPGATVPRWLPWSGAIAASLLLALMLVRATQAPALPPASTQATASAPATGAAHPAEVLIESDVAVIADIEFYDWLEEQDALL